MARSIYAKGLCFKRRPSIGKANDAPVPPGVDWDIFLDIGNQGIHEMDVARWGLGRRLPNGVVSTRAKYVSDDEETPNRQTTTFGYADAELVFEELTRPRYREPYNPAKV